MSYLALLFATGCPKKNVVPHNPLDNQQSHPNWMIHICCKMDLYKTIRFTIGNPIQTVHISCKTILYESILLPTEYPIWIICIDLVFVVEMNRPLYDRPSNPPDPDHLQKWSHKVVGHPLCNRPANPDDKDHLQKWSHWVILFATSRTIRMIWIICKNGHTGTSSNRLADPDKDNLQKKCRILYATGRLIWMSGLFPKAMVVTYCPLCKKR